MKVTPLGKSVSGVVALPGDKSISHRALILAALAQGSSELRHVGSGGDNKATIACLKKLGVQIEGGGEQWHVTAPDRLSAPKSPLDCDNSGTSMRLFAGLLSGLGFEATLVGDASLSKRPMKRVAEPLAKLGAQVETTDGHAPLQIKPANLTAAAVETGKPSAQVKTALVLAGLFAQGETVVTEPELTRDHTERMMRALGFPLLVEHGRLHVRPLTTHRPHGFSYWVPGDPSSSAFWAVLATLIPGSDVTLIDLSLNPTRIGYIDVLRRMGADISVTERGVSGGEPWGDIRIKAAAQLRATDVSGHEAHLAIDELPILMVAMAHAEGRSSIRDASDLRVKESDRIASMAALLHSAGVVCEVVPDGISITGGPLNPAKADAHLDHRIALSAAVMGMIGPEVEIDGFEAAAVSYGGFLREVKRMTGTSTERGKAITVAIDGPAGAGKSTVSRMLADRLGYTLVDTGAVYRSVALLASRSGVDPNNGEALEPLAQAIDVRFVSSPAGQRVLCQGEDVTDAIRTPEVSKLASIVSAHRQVRDALLEIQRKLAGEGGAVLEGRDIGTVVFPQAEAKFFLDAAAEERARRRMDELAAKQHEADFEQVLREIRERDSRDAARDVAPLKPAEDAVLLDSTRLDVAQVVSEMERRVRAKEKP